MVDDFVSLPDLAPTFLETADANVPDVMTARSLWPVLKSKQQGLVDPKRTYVVAGRERTRRASQGRPPAVSAALDSPPGFSLRPELPTERYPLGDPYRLDSQQPPEFDQVANNTFVTLPDEDAGPTKAWLVEHRADADYGRYFEHAYGRRPEHELFDLRVDPDQMHNVAEAPEYVEVRSKLSQQLLQILQESGDPRLKDNGRFFETPPMAGPLQR